MTSTSTRASLLAWRLAVFAIFTASGLSIATWASRVPSIRSSLGVDNSTIGLLLLGAGAASILGLSLASVLIARLGTRRGMLLMMLTFAAGLVLIGVGTDLVGSLPLVLVGLALFGLGNGALDVMMNVDGAAIEVQVGKTILPLFHAFFSFGTVIGAGLGALAAASGVSVFVHATSAGLAIAVIAVVAFAYVPQRDLGGDDAAADAGWRERLGVSLSAWREPRTYALGVVMLGMAFAEGGANDWMALGVTQGHGGAEEQGALALTVFSVAMAVLRLLGGPLVDRFGRVATLRVLAVTAVVGILLFILADDLPLVFVGAALWGMGASLGFPLGMSAAADDPAKAAARVSAAATVGYVAFLCGPPILGVISDHVGLLNTLFIIAGLVAASGLASAAARPLPGTRGTGH
ncbi:MFS transporter [Microbacterium sp. EYE_5]|uniref:MFS transporter n=1 Tax=unclassified Microbacterium TaxID=2609290 RepID=UPI002004CF55|nr:MULTISPECIES: MFS transporter [unclassified Microbacterium]MCK6079619.1 MFS transporter [Microbacterium sp. EYE_382]MCK6084890.1 MFS transporter [Microbacterium sp. EYE_384]MCK6122884.1 MFS transporter [Microbacterium sp. EYE_80]MCK6125653.1 MFS transporter [Microbacterium sp. EYE_79]MCK6140574.1 MFS transporter [Microbacterium sp. EYE_39]